MCDLVPRFESRVGHDLINRNHRRHFSKINKFPLLEHKTGSDQFAAELIGEEGGLPGW